MQVGVLIGKAGDTIRYLQYNSGAKIQITRDADADPQCATRPVELIGSSDSIDKAEKLINAVIAEVILQSTTGFLPALISTSSYLWAYISLLHLYILQAEAGGSPSLVARGLSPAQAAAGAEQIQIQVPNEKVIISLFMYDLLMLVPILTLIGFFCTGWINNRERWGDY